MKQVCILGPDGSGKTTLIPKLARLLQEHGLNTACVSTTREVLSYPQSVIWRKQLIDKDSTAFERFNAARSLYTASVSEYVREVCIDNLDSLDVLLLDRGGSSMVTYNRINHRDPFSLIPKVDVAVYLDSEFDTLTERIQNRGTHDFQDTDVEYRRKIWAHGPLDFQEWLDKNPLMKGFKHDTTGKSSQANAEHVFSILFPILQEIRGKGPRTTDK